MTSVRHLLVAGALVVCAAGYSTSAHAIAPLLNGYGGVVGYGNDCLSANDDGSSFLINLTPFFPAGLQFFTATHSNVYVNTNGNITFSGPVSTYTPNAFPVAAQPMIAPYWGDVDIRNVGGICMGSAGVTCTVCTPCHNPTQNGVWWHLEPGRMVVTWDRVGYYSCNNNTLMSFQLVITEATGCGTGPGDFDVEFRYNECGWETGDASGGTNGFGGTEAQAGFDAGNQVDFLAIPGSMAPGIAANLCNNSNVAQSGIWQFQIRSGAVLCPDAGDPCDTGLLGVCATGRNNCVGSTTECVQDVQPSAEVCDGLDNDCDGDIDEDFDGPLCANGLVCSGGTCVPRCTELGCDEGEVCIASGLCVDEDCVDVTCPPGLVCREGQCVGPCDGVICPWGRQCAAGRCLDLCSGLMCDDCTICEGGSCIPKCEHQPCLNGWTCQADGSCIEDSCIGVMCNPGFHCEAGVCVDNCAGAVCPGNEVCEVGECVDPPPTGEGGGTVFDPVGGGGNTSVGDGGHGGAPFVPNPSDDDFDPGTPAPNCNCEVAGVAAPISGALAWLFGALLIGARRRREDA